MIPNYFITVCPQCATLSIEFYPFFADIQGIPGPGGDRGALLRHRPPQPGGEAGAEGAGILHAGDQQLPLGNGGSGQHHGLASQGLHPGDQARTPGHHIGEPVLHHSLAPDSLHHLHLGHAALHVHRQPGYVVQLQQHVVAHILLIDLQPRGADGDAIVLQGPEHRLRGHGLVAADPELPDEEVSAEQQQPEQGEPGQQHIPLPHPLPYRWRAPPPQHGDLRPGLLGHLPQQGVLPHRQAHSHADLRFPCQIPEQDVSRPQQIQHPFRAGALDLHPLAALEKVDHFLIHITPSAPPA